MIGQARAEMTFITGALKDYQRLTGDSPWIRGIPSSGGRLSAEDLYALVATNANTQDWWGQPRWSEVHRLTDPWGSDYQFELSRKPLAGSPYQWELQVWSAGPNLREDNRMGDDVLVPAVAMK